MLDMTPDTLAHAALPAVPLTVEGASVLHQMMRFRRPAWRALAAAAAEIRRVAPDWRSAPRTFRFNRAFWRELPLRVVFGSDWLRVWA